jgi:hypothetical protein
MCWLSLFHFSHDHFQCCESCPISIVLTLLCCYTELHILVISKYPEGETYDRKYQRH